MIFDVVYTNRERNFLLLIVKNAERKSPVSPPHLFTTNLASSPDSLKGKFHFGPIFRHASRVRSTGKEGVALPIETI